MSNKESNIKDYESIKYGQSFIVQGSDSVSEKYYDIIIDIDSIRKLFVSGWDVNYLEEGEKKYNQQKNKNLTVVAVIGNKNKGKTYILQKISGNKLPLGYSITTKGISILYPRNDIQNIILLDSAGFEVPLVQSKDTYEFEIKDENKKKEYEDKLKEIKDKIKEAFNTKDESLELLKKEKEELETKKKSYIDFKELSSQIAEFTKDRRLTDYFLQKFILWNSDILLCVVGQLTFSDQKFINTIRSQVKNKKKKKLFIIHNLTTFVQKEQVEEYIKNTLLKSLTFDLEQIQIPKFGNKNEDENQYYWREKNNSSNNNSNNNDDLDIIHLVMANDDSDAGKYYNDSTIEYIKKQIIAYVNYSKFDIKNRVKEFLANVSNEIIDNQIEKDNIKIEGNKIIVNNINSTEVKLKNCLTDELGTNSFVSTIYKPKYRRYKKKDGEEEFYIIEIEIPGGVEDFSQILDKKVGNNIISIKGKKKVVNNETNKKNNSFNLEIKIPIEQVNLNEFINDRTEFKNGIYKLYYSIINNSSDSEEISLKEDDDDDDDGDDDDDDNDDDDDDDDNNNKKNSDDDDDDDND
jgi:hypothetical protein